MTVCFVLDREIETETKEMQNAYISESSKKNYSAITCGFSGLVKSYPKRKIKNFYDLTSTHFDKGLINSVNSYILS